MYVINEVTRGPRQPFSITVSFDSGKYDEHHAVVAYQEWVNRRKSSEVPIIQAALTIARQLDSYQQVAGRVLVVSGEISRASNLHLWAFGREIEVILGDLAIALATFLEATDVVVALGNESFRVVKEAGQ